uniref:Palmitoyltransferase n=1 Tax=Timema genevievae TaxID=629358 RepID=A0A7R9PGJ8_TIMGE|nr:unnamed protein product [Timema genevievae]
MHKQEWKYSGVNSPLCCCEYYNTEQERSHLLGCCCNCEDLDQGFDRAIADETILKQLPVKHGNRHRENIAWLVAFISVVTKALIRLFIISIKSDSFRSHDLILVVCERVPVERIAGIMSTFQDRLRVPWRGGAKQISMDSLLPIILQPLLAYIAAQNVWCTLLVFVSIHICIFYMYNIFMKFLPRTKFFLMWTLTSIVLLMTVFEINVVPLMEILPEENFVLIVFVVAALACAYKVRSRAPLNHVPHIDPADATGMVGNGKATEEVCSVCRKRVPPRTFHCRICQACVTKRDHHCVW